MFEMVRLPCLAIPTPICGAFGKRTSANRVPATLYEVFRSKTTRKRSWSIGCESHLDRSSGPDGTKTTRVHCLFLQFQILTRPSRSSSDPSKVFSPVSDSSKPVQRKRRDEQTMDVVAAPIEIRDMDDLERGTIISSGLSYCDYVWCNKIRTLEKVGELPSERMFFRFLWNEENASGNDPSGGRSLHPTWWLRRDGRLLRTGAHLLSGDVRIRFLRHLP